MIQAYWAVGMKRQTELLAEMPSVEKGKKTLSPQLVKYLTFSLAGEEYGVPILKVREIIGIVPITALPRTPPFVKGVINLRGKVIPVLDLRIRFGMEEAGYSERTCIVVVETKEEGRVVAMGMVVDTVSDVIHIAHEDIDAPPCLGTRLRTDCILGIARTGETTKILLDVDRITKINQDRGKDP